MWYYPTRWAISNALIEHYINIYPTGLMFMKVFKLTFCRKAISSSHFCVSHSTSTQSSTLSLQVGSSSVNCSINCRKLHISSNSNSWSRLHTKAQRLQTYHDWKTKSLSFTFSLGTGKNELSNTRSVREVLPLPLLWTYTATSYQTYYQHCRSTAVNVQRNFCLKQIGMK